MRGTRTARVCAGPIEEDPRLRLRGSIPLWASCDTFDAGPKAWLCGPATLPVVTSPSVARPCKSLASDSLQLPHCKPIAWGCQVTRSSDFSCFYFTYDLWQTCLFRGMSRSVVLRFGEV